MGWHRPYKERKYAVGQRLLTLRTRTKLTQTELAALVGVNRRSLQNWESGAGYPKEDGLQRLIAVFLAQGVFTPGQELVEAAQLWEQVSQDAPRPLALFDTAWFASLPTLRPQPPEADTTLIPPRNVPAPALPTGLVTFLATDIEGSTQRWEQAPQAMQQALMRHHAILRQFTALYHGQVFHTAGDSFICVFADASAALQSALAIQRALLAEPWPEVVAPLRVRMALHSGAATASQEGYVAEPTLNRLSRVLAASQGGQIVLTQAAVDLIGAGWPSGVTRHDLGVQQLRDVTVPLQLWQALAPDLPPNVPVLRPAPTAGPQVIDWGEAIDVPTLYGRETELATLEHWVLADRCRVVVLLGLGGIGKTSLAITLAQQVAARFDVVLFRSLRNAPPLAAVLNDLICAVAGSQASVPQGVPDKLARIVMLLRERRCLLVLDNLETMMEAGAQAGEFRADDARYGTLIQLLSETAHQSCLILTSREKPAVLAPLEGRTAPVRTLLVHGVDVSACQAILANAELFGMESDWAALARLYGGNPLALKLISEPIREIFGGDLRAFLQTGEAFFNGVGSLLDQQWERLSPVEQNVLTWLALQREPLGVQALRMPAAPAPGTREHLRALQALRRRSMVECAEGATLALQPVVREYITARLAAETHAAIVVGPPLVGRQAELQQLVGCLHHAQQGKGRMVFLIGEQGVGKTRLAEELVAYAQTARVRILRGAALEGEGQLLYAPFVEAIRRELTHQPLDRIRQQLGPPAHDLARLLPELASGAAWQDSASEADRNRLEMVTDEQDRRRLFAAIAATFASFARDRPLLVVLDNLHAADEASLQLLHYLAHQITQQRMLWVCLVDERKLQRGVPLTLLIGDLQRHALAQRLDLGPLALDELTQLCTQLLDDSVRESQIPHVVYELTEGNPLFAHDLVRALRTTGQLERRANGWHLRAGAKAIVPASIHEIIDLQLGRLSNDSYRLLEVAAVIGTSFSVALLQAVTQGDRGKLLDALEELRSEALVVSAAPGYRFQHTLIRQALYQKLAAERRAWLHERVAKAIEEAAGNQRDEQASVLAYHYEQAGDPVATLQYLIRAGDWARRAYALQEALEHYTRALGYARGPHSEHGADTVISLLERRSQTELARSNFDAAISDLEQLLTLCQERGQRTREGETLYQIGFAHYWAHRLMQASGYLDQAFAIADALDYRELRARALRLRDILHATQGRIADRAAVSAAGATDQPAVLHADELWGYAMLAHLRDDAELALRHAQACINVGKATANTFLILGGSFVLGMAHANLGDYQAALDSLLSALQLSETTSDRFWRARLLNTLGWVYQNLFSLDLALQYNQASLDLARTGAPRLTEAEGYALVNLATTQLLLGRSDQARAALDAGLALAEHETFMRWRYFTRLIIVQGQVALMDGDLSLAGELAHKALELARSTKSGKNSARACLLRGQVLLAMERIDEARSSIQEALSVAHQLHWLGMTLACQLALADVEQTDHQPQAAQTHQRAAQAIIGQIAGQLTDAALREQWLNAASVRKTFAL